MFSNVGWGEILVLLIVALIVIGPERLPGVIKEVRAVLLAIRNAVGQARQQLDNEFGDEIKSIAEPLNELNNVRRMGARGFITQTLFDGDESFLTPLDEAKKSVQSTVNSVKKPNLRDFAKGSAGVPSSENKAVRDIEVPPGPESQDTPAASPSADSMTASPDKWDDVI
ncbi:twin-arginine translocase subunit TatB [Corynebacterium sp. zg254]|uniref:Sec-independent protein translocase protein TatB n=1 Tax=Corynebacterium zhongnanshanii TaxID=2768834 RepID=A0ABQ6VFJ6_9CORY|nr:MULTISPECIES: Sec-independent protein translocase protein TatB [Corynebacterium]KAB3523181.1 twin-arginine translocase subunit TatB [Corynebacterium zhongnanshanii]MCR5913708.1 twin-arginine translocase subunit TatB [Corynebacterium sp. zg254]